MIRTTIPCPPGCFWVEDEYTRLGMLVKTRIPAEAETAFRYHAKLVGFGPARCVVYENMPVFEK